MGFYWDLIGIYPLGNIQKTIENHHILWVNQQTKWQCLNSYVSLPESILHKYFLIQFYIYS